MILTIDVIQDAIYRIKEDLGWDVKMVRMTPGDVKAIGYSLDLIWDNDSRDDTICGVELFVDEGADPGAPMFVGGKIEGHEGVKPYYILGSENKAHEVNSVDYWHMNKADRYKHVHDEVWLIKVLKDIGG